MLAVRITEVIGLFVGNLLDYPAVGFDFEFELPFIFRYAVPVSVKLYVDPRLRDLGNFVQISGVILVRAPDPDVNPVTIVAAKLLNAARRRRSAFNVRIEEVVVVANLG